VGNCLAADSFDDADDYRRAYDSNTIQIQHASISRTHLKLAKTPTNEWELEDLDSRFGTFVERSADQEGDPEAGRFDPDRVVAAVSV